jgi:hypothetical protein
MIRKVVSYITFVLLFGQGSAMAQENMKLEIASAGHLPALLRDSLVALGVCQKGTDAIAVNLIVSNAKESPLVLGKATQITCTLVTDGQPSPEPVSISGLFVQPFALGEGTSLKIEGGWVSWHNLEDAENPDLGTLAYLPIKQMELTIPPKQKVELYIVLPLTKSGKSFKLTFDSLSAVQVTQGQIISPDAWREHIQKRLGQAGGARNFIPRKAPPEALTSEGLPVLTIAGKKWRAQKGSSGEAGLVYFRRLGDNSLPFGGAGKFGTETLVSD